MGKTKYLHIEGDKLTLTLLKQSKMSKTKDLYLGEEKVTFKVSKNKKKIWVWTEQGKIRSENWIKFFDKSKKAIKAIYELEVNKPDDYEVRIYYVNIELRIDKLYSCKIKPGNISIGCVCAITYEQMKEVTKALKKFIEQEIQE